MTTVRPSMVTVPVTRARGISTSHDIFSHAFHATPTGPTGIASAAYHGAASVSYPRSQAILPSRLAPAMWYTPSDSTRTVPPGGGEPLADAPATAPPPASMVTSGRLSSAEKAAGGYSSSATMLPSGV